MTMILLALTLDVDSNGTNRSMRFINNAICDRYSRVAKLLIQFNASLASQATFAKKCFAYSGGLSLSSFRRPRPLLETLIILALSLELTRRI